MAATSGQLQTPRPEAGGSSVDQKAGTNWNSKKLRDEFDSIKSKVVDQRFDPSKWSTVGSSGQGKKDVVLAISYEVKSAEADHHRTFPRPVTPQKDF